MSPTTASRSGGTIYPLPVRSAAGLSLSNYNDYIGDQHPEMYIVRYFTDQFKDTVKTDLVYESHNNYLFVFISTGFVGAGLFLCFLVLVLVRVIRYILRHPPAVPVDDHDTGGGGLRTGGGAVHEQRIPEDQ